MSQPYTATHFLTRWVKHIAAGLSLVLAAVLESALDFNGDNTIDVREVRAHHRHNTDTVVPLPERVRVPCQPLPRCA